MLLAFVVLKSRADQLFRNYYFVKKFRQRQSDTDRAVLKTFKRALLLITALNTEKLVLLPGEEVPPEEPLTKSIEVQASFSDNADFDCTLDADFLRSRPDALARLLAHFTELRQKYLRK